MEDSGISNASVVMMPAPNVHGIPLLPQIVMKILQYIFCILLRFRR